MQSSSLLLTLVNGAPDSDDPEDGNYTYTESIDYAEHQKWSELFAELIQVGPYPETVFQFRRICERSIFPLQKKVPNILHRRKS